MNAAFMGAQQRGSAPPFISIAPKYLPGGKMPMPPLLQAPKSKPVPGLIRTSPKMQPPQMSSHLQRGGNLPGKMLYRCIFCEQQEL